MRLRGVRVLVIRNDVVMNQGRAGHVSADSCGASGAPVPCAIMAVLAVDGQDEMLAVAVEPEGAVGPVCTPLAVPAP